MDNHFETLLFPIGIFPVVMIACSTLFCDPSWPRRWWRLSPVKLGGATSALSRLALTTQILAVAVIILIPARHLLHPNPVNWTEEGFRFSWRVMLIEKTGLVDYRVVDKASGQTWHVQPAGCLTHQQHKQMRTQPDMIRDYALHLKRTHQAEGREVAVYADSWASLHQRPAQRMIRPDIDLTLDLHTLRAKSWILPLAEP